MQIVFVLLGIVVSIIATLISWFTVKAFMRSEYAQTDSGIIRLTLLLVLIAVSTAIAAKVIFNIASILLGVL